MLRALALLLAIGCGDEPTDDGFTPPPPLDGGTPDGGSAPECAAEVAAPAEPIAPATIDWPCPEGWRAEDGACSPWPESGPADCPEGEAHFPGTRGCEPIGTACPSGQFTDPPPEYADWDRIYVDASAPPGGDGMTAETATSSFVSAVRNAYRASAPTAVILAKGEYSIGGFPLGDDVLLWGACVRDTVVKTSTVVTEHGLFTGTDTGVAVIGNLTVRSHLIALASLDAAVLRVQGVLIDGAGQIGIYAVRDGIVRGERVVARNVDWATQAAAFVAQGGTLELTQAIATGVTHYGAVVLAGISGSAGEMRLTDFYSTGNGGGGALVGPGGSLQLERAAIMDNAGFGLRLEDGTLRARDLIVSDTSRVDDSVVGRGLEILSGSRSASATIQRALFARNNRTGIYLAEEGSMLSLEDAIVRDTQSIFVQTGTTADFDDNDGAGYGLWVTDRTTARVERARFERNHHAGIYASDVRAQLFASDIVIADTRPGLTVSPGEGITLRRTATASIARARLERNAGSGIEVLSRSTAMLEDVAIVDSAIDRIGEGAPGIVVAEEGSTAYVNRGLLSRNELFGVIVQDGGWASLNDVAIVDTQPMPDGRNGAGLGASSGSEVYGSRVWIERGRTVGIIGYDRARFELSDLVVRETLAGEANNGFVTGRGISLEIGVTATIARARIEDNLEVAVLATEGSQLLMTDASIARTNGIDGVSGRGMQAQSGSVIALERVCLRENREVGILASKSDIVGREVTVLDTQHNACFDDGTCDIPGGIGMYAAPGGRFGISGFTVSRSAESGITIAEGGPLLGLSGGEMDLIDGVVSYNMLGADVRNPAFNRERITLRVVYENNANNGIESRSTPLPDTNTAGLY